ncbi:hypothetical protein JAAARDRAFT_59322 [Jaapia argillacea MUCL 33604]|uniref:Uncharacterized protein n=1 Tax=Jaapia argillacea MUCL 33604 TaxID=933084 RepID=A0A067Q1K4_9AGAM|nr:hypothetical protein JAAARDRAFT_59322 [Jaapia argillacea MUCL 33604]
MRNNGGSYVFAPTDRNGRVGVGCPWGSAEVTDMRLRAGLSPTSGDSSAWSFTEQLHQLCDPQSRYLNALRNTWRSNTVKVPRSWLDELNQRPPSNLDHEPLSETLRLVRQNLQLLEPAEVRSSMVSLNSVEPELCTLTQINDSGRRHPFERHAEMNEWCLYDRVEAIVHCDGTEWPNCGCLEDFFHDTPGFLEQSCPGQKFPRSMCPPDRPVDDLTFAILNQPFGSTGHPDLDDTESDIAYKRQVSRDRHLKICLSHPALLLGLDVELPTESTTQDASSRLTAISDLALHAQASIDTMVIAWSLRHSDCKSGGIGPTGIHPLPEWAIVFGLLCEEDKVTIIAHHPTLEIDPAVFPPGKPNGTLAPPRYRYQSSILDTFAFHQCLEAPPDGILDESIILERLRLATAMLALRKHLIRLSTIFDCVEWPGNIGRVEDELERSYSLYVPTPSPSEGSPKPRSPRGDVDYFGEDECAMCDAKTEKQVDKVGTSLGSRDEGQLEREGIGVVERALSYLMSSASSGKGEHGSVEPDGEGLRQRVQAWSLDVFNSL